MRRWSVFSPCLGSVFKFQLQLLKIWTWSDLFVILKLRITDILMHLQLYNTLNHKCSAIKFGNLYFTQSPHLEGSFREVSVGNWRSSQCTYFEFAGEELAFKGLLKASLGFWSRDLSNGCHGVTSAWHSFCFHDSIVTSIVYGRPSQNMVNLFLAE